ncbi:MAG: hypothetical protein K2P67_01640 [Gallionellaceae bacterium]|nr:hypothetical protein [Gallionellaceae bacterium]
MKKDLLIFFAALAILGVTFAKYLDWLSTQSKHEHGIAKMKVHSSQHVHFKQIMR